MTKQEVQKFRAEFQKTVAQLEKDFGVNINLGTIRFDANELRAKMTARKGEVIEKGTKDDFQVGDIVGINHKKVNPRDQFRIIKIMSKNIKVVKLNVSAGNIAGEIRVSPSLLVKK